MSKKESAKDTTKKSAAKKSPNRRSATKIPRREDDPRFTKILAAFEAIKELDKQVTDEVWRAILRRVGAVKGTASTVEELHSWMRGFDDWDDETRRILSALSMKSQSYVNGQLMLKILVMVTWGPDVDKRLVLSENAELRRAQAKSSSMGEVHKGPLQ